MHVLQVFTSSLISKNLREKWFCIHEDMPDRVSEWLTVDEDELEPMFVYKDPNSEVVGKKQQTCGARTRLHLHIYLSVYIYT